jgi:Flp pilus assembly protein TadG
MKRMKQHWEQGQSFIELAFGMVILILLIGGLIDLGRSFLILVAVENATGEGALYGATHPECLTKDYGPSICQATEGGTAVNAVEDRVREEGKPIINLTDANSTIDILVDDVALADDLTITKGVTLSVKVVYHYSPVTPIGFLIWGDEAEVRAEAKQELLSPPRPGYQY